MSFTFEHDGDNNTAQPRDDSPPSEPSGEPTPSDEPNSVASKSANGQNASSANYISIFHIFVVLSLQLFLLK